MADQHVGSLYSSIDQKHVKLLCVLGHAQRRGRRGAPTVTRAVIGAGTGKMRHAVLHAEPLKGWRARTWYKDHRRIALSLAKQVELSPIDLDHGAGDWKFPRVAHLSELFVCKADDQQCAYRHEGTTDDPNAPRCEAGRHSNIAAQSAAISSIRLLSMSRK